MLCDTSDAYGVAERNPMAARVPPATIAGFCEMMSSGKAWVSVTASPLRYQRSALGQETVLQDRVSFGRRDRESHEMEPHKMFEACKKDSRSLHSHFTRFTPTPVRPAPKRAATACT